jgi:hypothetical protein
MADLTREQIEERIQTALNLMQELGFPANVNDKGFCGCGECRNCLVGMAHNSLDELTEALRQLLSATEWKPIDLADEFKKPTEKFDYPDVLLWIRGAPYIGSWYDDMHAKNPRPFWIVYGSLGKTWCRANQPTHFRALPPSTPTEGE